MKDYASMSDFEINCEVLSVFSPDINYMCLSGDNSCFYDCGPIGDGWNQIDIPDYCNNPADAWPILLEHHIAVVPFDGSMPCAWPAGEGLVSKHLTEDENPLRAGMIVFLKMKEGEL